MRTRPRWIRLVAVPLLALVACGGPLHERGRAQSIRSTRVCINDRVGGCFDAKRFDVLADLQVGDCVEMERAAESARVLTLNRVGDSKDRCPAERE